MARKIRTERQAGANVAINTVWFIFFIIINIIFYMAAAFLIYKASTFAYDFCYQVFGDGTVDEGEGRNAMITINPGASTMELASTLEMNKIINNRYSFYIRVKLMNSNIMAGTYIVNSAMTYDDILETITDYNNAIEPGSL